MHLSKQIESMYDDAVRIRQDLHRIPEIGFQLRDSAVTALPFGYARHNAGIF